MQPNDSHHSPIELIRLIARREKGITVRIFVSLAATCVMIAVALIASYIVAYLNQNLDTRSGRNYFYVTDTHLAVGFSGATLIWGTLLYWIWRGQIGRKNILGPIIATAIIGGITACIGVTINELTRREEEYLIAATCLIAAALVCIIWMRYTLSVLQGIPVLTKDREVNVACPQCGYSLIGLNELRCPECGTTFAIDELIRAQGYGNGVLVDSDGTAGVVNRQDERRTALTVEDSC